MYDAIIRVLRRSSANDEPRFVAEGQRITIDFAGLDTALTTSGVERSSSFAAIERRYPAMRFVFDSSAAPCAGGDVLAACRVQAGASTVRFEDPVADARETFTFLMVVTDVVGRRGKRAASDGVRDDDGASGQRVDVDASGDRHSAVAAAPLTGR